MSEKKEQIMDMAILPKKSLKDRLEAFFNKNEKKFALFSIILSTISSILLFDTKVSLSGDDCDYIVAAGDFWKSFIYPGHHGALYPMILAPFIGIFGINLILLKAISAIFMVASIWLFYKSFQHIVPAIILIPAMILVSINPYVFFFASYTYSEPLFMFMQALFFYLFSRYFWKNDQVFNIKKDWKKYLALALVIMGIGLTRTIGFSIIGVIILYFIIERRWKDLIYITGFFALIFGLFYFAKPIIWPNSPSVQSFETLLAKNPYNTSYEMEDLPGLLNRIKENSHIYLSGFLFQYFGLRQYTDFPLEHIPVLSILSYILFAICFIFVFRKNKALLFTGLYVGALTFISFVLLHKLWAQDRMIMIYYPYILLFLTGGFYYIFNRKNLNKLFFVFPIIIVSLLIGTGIHAKIKIGKNIPILQQNILGDDLYGLTPDWENFVKMSRWVDENIDENIVVASRKPTMSYVYTGRTFAGIYSVPRVNIEDLIKSHQEDKDKSTFLVVENINNVLINALDPYMQYVFTTIRDGSFYINGKIFNTAFAYKIDNNIINNEELINFLETNGFNYTFEYEAFLKQYVDDKNNLYQIVSPDALLKVITDSNIRYFILAKLRVYTAENTGLYVNTIHQYIYFIQYKYSEMFRLVHTIGKEEDCGLAEYLGN